MARRSDAVIIEVAAAVEGPRLSGFAVAAVVPLTDEGLGCRAARRAAPALVEDLRTSCAAADPLRTTVEALEDEVDPRLAAMLVDQVERLDRLPWS